MEILGDADGWPRGSGKWGGGGTRDRRCLGKLGEGTDIGGGGGAQSLIGDQRERDLGALRHPEQNFLDHIGAGIGIDQDLHNAAILARDESYFLIT